ncbi:MAG TPA: ABC transporter ATP-binding protein [Thermoanaerobaculia bacterium]|nr:ABC transporter ATP-binding protein [Thermoanaerobaculia bacterium]
MHGYKRLLRYIARQWHWFAGIAVLTVASAASAALQPWPMKLLVDYALGDAELPPQLASGHAAASGDPTPAFLLFVAVGAHLGLFLLNSALTAALTLSWTNGGQRMVYDLASDVFAKLQRLSPLFHSRRSVGDSLSRLSGDTWCIYSVANGLLMSPLQRLATLGAMAAVGFALDPLLAALSLAAAPLLAFSARFFGRRLKQRAKRGRESSSRIASFVQQTFSAMPVVQAFSTEDRNREQLESLAEDAVEIALQGRLLNSAYGLVNGAILSSGAALVLVVGGFRVLDGAIPLGTLLVFLSYIRKMQGSAGGLFTIFAKLKTAEASIERLMEILECDQEVREAPNAKPLPATPSGKSGHVMLEDVSFGYEPRRPVLNGVTLEARPGEVVALVGPSGAGKSTLMSLIPRLLDPWQGRVLIDGSDVRMATLDSVRARTALVSQETLLLPMTVAENIAYGRPGASRSEIHEAAIAAQADAFIRRLPNDYDTVIGERGASLSGGERQRLSFARALLKNAPILLLDEPTAALDAETEAQLLEALRQIMEGRTTFLVAHRLSTVRDADRIVVLEDGRVVEIGSHQELLARRGAYERLYHAQFPPAAREVVA